MYKVEVLADSSGKWAGNALTFDTRETAEEYARDLFFRWTQVREWRVVIVLDAIEDIAQHLGKES